MDNDKARDHIVDMFDRHDRLVMSAGFAYGALQTVLLMIDQGHIDDARAWAGRSIDDLKVLMFTPDEGDTKWP